MSVGAWTKLSSIQHEESAHIGGKIFAKMVGQNCPQMAFVNPTPIRISARTQLFLGERIFRGGIETRGSERRRTIRVRAQQRRLRGTSIATLGRLTPNVCLPTPSLTSPAPEILDYLARHPEAQDTIDGILHCRVLDACIRKWAPKIAETVAQLVEKGFLEQS